VVPAGVVPALRERAVAKYRADRRDALLGFLAPSLICMFIWLVLGADSFFWPGFVIAGTGVNWLSMLIRRENIIEDNLRRLEKKPAKDRDPDRHPDEDEDE
jgi:hypothetical protein